VTDVDPELHNNLVELAERNRHTLNAEALRVLRTGLAFESAPKPNLEQIFGDIAEIRARVRGTLSNEEIRAAIQEGRE
jgi:hypothetical protein